MPSDIFNKVTDFNIRFGVMEPNPKLNNDCDLFCFKLIGEEVVELIDAVNANNKVEVLDALVDIVYVTLGAATRKGAEESNHDIINFDIKDYNTPFKWDRALTCIAYVATSFNELKNEFSLDNLECLLINIAGMAKELGLKLKSGFELVHDNNMSKICQTLDDANETVYYYKFKPELGFTTPTYRNINGTYVVYNESTKKILKPISYKPVDLTSIV